MQIQSSTICTKHIPNNTITIHLAVINPNMPTYAVLGATGATGSELVKLLLSRPDVELHLYARSKERLESKFPTISSNPKVQTFYGAFTDIALLSRCISGTSAVFSTVATNNNEPRCSVAQTIAHSLVKAFEQLRADKSNSNWEPPRIIWLSSASRNQKVLMTPKLVKAFVYRCFWYIYEDLRAAEEFFASEAPWIPLTRCCPGGLIDDEAQGVETGEFTHSETIAYPDLAAGMIMMAEDERSRGQTWSVKSKGPERPDLLTKTNGHRLVMGLLSSYIPGAFGFFRWMNWW